MLLWIRCTNISLGPCFHFYRIDSLKANSPTLAILHIVWESAVFPVAAAAQGFNFTNSQNLSPFFIACLYGSQANKYEGIPLAFLWVFFCLFIFKSHKKIARKKYFIVGNKLFDPRVLMLAGNWELKSSFELVEG